MTSAEREYAAARKAYELALERLRRAKAALPLEIVDRMRIAKSRAYRERRKAEGRPVNKTAAQRRLEYQEYLEGKR